MQEDPLTGRCIAEKYQVIALLGKGAMGSVYRAEHVALSRPVALKVLHPHMIHNDSVVHRFLREARTSSRLSHPNIVTLLDFGQDPEDGLLYLVMEYLEGRSLGKIVEEEVPALDRTVALAKQILLALDEAHALGIVHRDLKPENIIVVQTRKGTEQVKVVDFGLAHLIGADDPKLTSSGLVCGTPSYISPEQAKTSEVGPATDIYSFGVILFEIVTGQLPFDAQSAYEMVSRHLTEPAPHPSLRAPKRYIPDSLAEVILRCLEKEPEERFAEAADVLDALDEIERSGVLQAEYGVDAGTPSPPTLSGAGAFDAEPPLFDPEEPGEQHCPTCGGLMPPDAQFCGSCGTEMTASGERCAACGAFSPPGQLECAVCGLPLSAAATGPAIPRDKITARLGELLARAEEDATGDGSLLGRHAECDTLAQAGRRAVQGQGAAILLYGEPGIGKSTLLRHAAGRLRGSGLTVHLTRALQSGWSAISTLTRSLLGCPANATEKEIHQSLAGLSGLDDTDRAALTFLVQSPSTSASLAARSLDLACATAIRRLARALGDTGPQAILLDDAEHLSRREQTVLKQLATATGERPILLVVTTRDPDGVGWLGAEAQRIEIRPLQPREIEHLLRLLVGDLPLSADTASRVLELAAGNPLVLAECAWLLQRHGARALAASPTSGTGIQAAIRPLVLSHFEALDPVAKDALAHAAVVGRSFPFELLYRLMERHEWLQPALEGLLEQGLLEQEPGVASPRIRFRHETVREIIYETLDQTQREAAHDKVASLLAEGVDPQSSCEELGRHLELAGRYAEAAEQHEAAAARRVDLGQPEEAAALWELAVSALERAGMAEHVARLLDLKIRLAHALNQAGRARRAEAVALEVRNRAQSLGDVLLATRAARELARAADAGDNAQLAESMLREARQTALECGDLDLAADLAADLARVLERAGRLSEALTILERTYARLEGASRRSRISQEVANPAQMAEVLELLGRLALRLNRADDAVRHLQTALKHAQLGNDRDLTGRVLDSLGHALVAAGDTHGAAEALNRAAQTARGSGDWLSVAKLLHDLARLHLEAGGTDRARELARQSLAVSTDIGWPEGAALGAAVLRETD
jgi:tRNA A-37 threonylcarbamoyl transferase component Bud32/tetratricopeptide (TPR) repeat protein